MLNINDKAAALLCRACLPCMAAGSFILNVASASAFQPNPYIALYSASKAFLLSFTRSLNVENKSVTCTAVCPGWVDTKMLPKDRNGKQIRYPGMVTADKLYRLFPDMPEGKMSRLRAELVCEQSLHAVALSLDLGRCLKLGRGDGRSKKEAEQAAAKAAMEKLR